ncbi:MAG: CpaF family protein [Candidatus Hydrogenedentota bacterium]
MGLMSRLGQAQQATKTAFGAKTPIVAQVAQKEGDKYVELKSAVHEKIVAELDPELLNHEDENLKRSLLSGQVEEFIITVGSEKGISLTRQEHMKLLGEIIDEILGLGPIEPLIKDDTISEVMVNGPQMVYIEQKGKLILTNVKFKDNEHILHIIEKIISPLGRRCDESMPYVDARLKDGSRVNAIIPPLALNGPTITIRKFKKDPLTIDDLVRFGAMTKKMADFLDACVKIRLNIVVSGGTGSGKTTLLNVLSSFIPADERIITVEDAAELQLRQPHWVRLETRPPNIEGKGAVSMRELIKNTLRMRPDRVVVGECRGGEALDMLQAMNTGHDGSLTTGHANTPRDMIRRLETMCLMAGMELPVRAIREQIASAIDLIIQQSRFKDGSRKVEKITEVQGMEGDTVVLSDIFEFKQTGKDENGKILGDLRPTGIVPTFYERFAENGIHLPQDIFTP